MKPRLKPRRLRNSARIRHPCLRCVLDALEQLRSGDPERPRQLGDSSHARLALAALDLRDMGHMEIGAVRQTFLAKPHSYLTRRRLAAKTGVDSIYDHDPACGSRRPSGRVVRQCQGRPDQSGPAHQCRLRGLASIRRPKKLCARRCRARPGGVLRSGRYGWMGSKPTTPHRIHAPPARSVYERGIGSPADPGKVERNCESKGTDTHYSPVRQGHRIRLLLAATANIHGVPLLTHNIQDFRIISDLTDVCDPSALQPVKPEPATESVSDDEQEEPPAT